MGLIRILLAVSVMVAHIGPIIVQLIDGQVAVLAFFIISGFYMNLILTEQYKSSRIAFLANRALRLYPTYYVMFFLSLYFSYRSHSCNIMIAPEFADQMSRIELLWYRITNLIIFGQDITSALSPAKFHNNCNHPVSPAWTLASELVFYIVISFLPLRKTPRIILIVAIALLSYWVRTHWWPTNRYPISTIVFFMSGALSYYLYAFLKTVSFPLEKWIGYGMIALLSCFICLQPLKDFLPFIDIANDQPRSLFFTLVCVLTPFIFKTTRYSQVDRFIGDLSYPIYIAHMVVIRTWHWLFPFYATLGWGPGSTITIVTFAMAIALYFLVEQPINHYREKIKTPIEYDRDVLP